MNQSQASLETVFLDAAGTLIELSESVGHGYARIAKQHHFHLDAEQTNQVFGSLWQRTPSPNYPSSSTFAERDAIDRQWWRHLVDQILTQLDRHPGAAFDPYFSDLFQHYATPAAWRPFPGTHEALAMLAKHYRIFVFSNFDERLVSILKAWRLDTHLSGILFSTALGASKPDPEAFSAALNAANANPKTTLHVGDDLQADGQGARDSGLAFFHVYPPAQDLQALLKFLQKQPD